MQKVATSICQMLTIFHKYISEINGISLHLKMRDTVKSTNKHYYNDEVWGHIMNVIYVINDSLHIPVGNGSLTNIT